MHSHLEPCMAEAADIPSSVLVVDDEPIVPQALLAQHAGEDLQHDRLVVHHQD